MVHAILVGILVLINSWLFLVGLKLAIGRAGSVTDMPLNNALAVISNKVLGGVYVMGSMIVYAVLLI